MSSGRSRSGGRSIRITLSRKKRSSRKRPPRSRARGPGWWRRRCARRCAATRVPPSRWNSRSWSTRSSFAWVAGAMSPISSRKSVPPLACSKRPIRWRSAPVKAPRSWPKSSDSSSVSGSAAQLTLTKGPLGARREAVDQPGDQLLAGARLARDEHRRARRRHPARELEPRAAPGSSPTMFSGAKRAARSARRCVTSRSSRPCSSAARRGPRAARGRRASARSRRRPRRIASTATSIVPYAVIRITALRASRTRAASQHLESACAGQPQVGDDHVVEAIARVARAGPSRCRRRPPRDCAPKPSAQRARDAAPQRVVVLDDEEARARGSAARTARSALTRPPTQRQTNAEDAQPPPASVLEFEPAAVSDHDLLRLRESHAGSALLGREERVEDRSRAAPPECRGRCRRR